MGNLELRGLGGILERPVAREQCRVDRIEEKVLQAVAEMVELPEALLRRALPDN